MKERLLIRKMRVEANDPIHYHLQTADGCLSVNDWIGSPITLTDTGRRFCIHCARQSKKLFQQGFCYPCYRELQACNLCIIHPERCRVMEGCCPEDHWAHQHCHANQVIYLSHTSGLKVGITQEKNCPSRWIDQGAVGACAVMTASNRFLAGQVEVALKAFVADKTQWRTMLRESPEPPDLVVAWHTLLEQAELPLMDLIETYGEEEIGFIADPAPVSFHYPLEVHPTTIKTHSLDKTPEVSGVLQGMKGQYLILDTGVMNIRKFSGYEVDVSV